jgi:hypothetical protein
MCKLINDDNICVDVHWNDGVPSWKLLGYLKDAECIAGQDRRLEERGDLLLPSLLLHDLTHQLVWCHDRSHLMLKFQAPICEMVGCTEMIS